MIIAGQTSFPFLSYLGKTLKSAAVSADYDLQRPFHFFDSSAESQANPSFK